MESGIVTQKTVDKYKQCGILMSNTEVNFMVLKVISEEEKTQIINKLTKLIKRPNFEKVYTVKYSGIGCNVYYKNARIFSVTEEPGHWHTIENLESDTVIEFFDNQCGEIWILLKGVAAKQQAEEEKVKKQAEETQKKTAQSARLNRIDEWIEHTR